MPHREQAVLKHVADIGGSGPFPAVRLQNIYSTLLAQMRSWEEEQHFQEVGAGLVMGMTAIAIVMSPEGVLNFV